MSGLTASSNTYRRHSSDPRLIRLTWVFTSTSSGPSSGIGVCSSTTLPIPSCFATRHIRSPGWGALRLVPVSPLVVAVIALSRLQVLIHQRLHLGLNVRQRILGPDLTFSQAGQRLV